MLVGSVVSMEDLDWSGRRLSMLASSKAQLPNALDSAGGPSKTSVTAWYAGPRSTGISTAKSLEGPVIRRLL
jgi:hypothetical protein